jgi:hypothetical protein
MDGVRSRIVLPNLIIGYAGESTSESIRNGSVTTDHISVILHNADPPHFHFSGLIFANLSSHARSGFRRAPTRQKVIRHGANFPTVFTSVRQKAEGRISSFSSARQEMNLVKSPRVCFPRGLFFKRTQD